MASSRQNQARAPTLEDIEQQYSQLPPQYRQAVFEKKQREYQQGLLQQPPSRSEPVRNTSVSLSSSPTRPSEGGPGPGTLTRAASSAWSATRQRIVSAPLSTYRKDHDSDSSSITSNITGPGRAHWKPDNSTNVCTWPGCKVEFGLFDRRHHCRKCGDIFCNTHCSKEVPLDYTLDFNPAEGVMSRACVGCHEAYGQWHVHPPSNRNHRAEGLKRNISNPNTSTTTKSPPSAGSASSSSTLGRKLNTGRIPDGFLGGDLTIEGIGREDIVRQPGSVNIAIKKQPSSDSATHMEHVKTAKELDKFLQERPPPEELVEKNILKDTKVSPALQQHAEELKKAQLEDTLNSKLEHRPPVSELVEHNILHETHVAPSLQRQADELKRSQLEDKLTHKIDHRPTHDDLVTKNILHESTVSPAIQQQTEDLKRTMLESSLNAMLENRPTEEQLVERHIL